MLSNHVAVPENPSAGVAEQKQNGPLEQKIRVWRRFPIQSVVHATHSIGVGAPKMLRERSSAM